MRFILIDRILELVPGENIVAYRKIDPSDDYFRDHFPGFPVVPGVLLTEMMAQTAGKCLDAERSPRGKAMLTRILSASFRRWVVPGQEVWVHATIRKNTNRYATANCHIEVDGARPARADLFFSFLPVSNLDPGYRDRVLEDYLESVRGGEGGRHG